MRRLLLLVATWSIGTALAVTLAWSAVDRVSSEVTDRPVAPISNDEVAAALRAAPGTPDPAAPTGTTSSTAVGTATTAPPATPTTTRSSPTTTPSPTSPTPTSPPAGTPGPTAAPAAPATTATIDSVGGQAAVRYEGGRVVLLWAVPKPGFTGEVDDAGPGEVDVRFDSDDHESRIRAFYRDGAPAREVREDADGDDGGDD